MSHTHARPPPPTTRKKETLPFAITRMSLEGVTLCEISLTEKYKYCGGVICNRGLKSPPCEDGEWNAGYRGWGRGVVLRVQTGHQRISASWRSEAQPDTAVSHAAASASKLLDVEERILFRQVSQYVHWLSQPCSLLAFGRASFSLARSDFFLSHTHYLLTSMSCVYAFKLDIGKIHVSQRAVIPSCGLLNFAC